MSDAEYNLDSTSGSGLPDQWDAFLLPKLSDLGTTAAPPHIVDRARSLASLLPTAYAGDWWSQRRTKSAVLLAEDTLLAGSALRGDKIRSFGFQHAETRIDLEIEPVRASTHQQGIVRGQVETTGPCQGVPVAFVEKAGGQAISTTLDELGFFSAILPSGTYDIAFAMPGVPICMAAVLVQ